MSIQTELTRITNAKAAIKKAIEGKGVTVPDATLLDGLAALIASIEAVGGGEIDFSPFKSIIYGTYTPAEDVNSFSVPNPNNVSGSNAFFVISRRNGSIGSNQIDSAFIASMYNTIQRLRYSSGKFNNNYPCAMNFSNFSFDSYYLAAGVTYWYAYGVK